MNERMAADLKVIAGLPYDKRLEVMLLLLPSEIFRLLESMHNAAIEMSRPRKEKAPTP